MAKKRQTKKQTRYQPQKNKQQKQIKKRKIKYGRIIIALCFLAIIISIFYEILNIPIKNIYIKGNNYLKDQEIIEMSGIENYPSLIRTSSSKIKRKLEKETFIKKANVKKQGTTITITIEENRPLYYYATINKTILLDKTEVSDLYSVPNVVNYIPDTIYEKFIKNMKKVDLEVLMRISEIKYDPNEVDEGRFLLTMSDGNYVYLTITKFENINSYIDIIKQKKFENKKGILYLDAGNSFEIIEN